MGQSRESRNEDKSEREGGGAERAGGAGRNGRRAHESRPALVGVGLGWPKVGSACLGSSAGDWRPATAVEWTQAPGNVLLGWAVTPSDSLL